MTDKVTQADRDAMADILQSWDLLSGLTIEHIRLGRYDGDPAFEFLPRANTELVEALRGIACFDDTRASEHLERYGLFSLFDEPGSVEIARKALSLYAKDGDER